MNTAIPTLSVRPSDRQLMRRLINSYRHGFRKVPWSDVDFRAWKAADRLDRAEERRYCRRMAESRPVDTDDWFERGEMKRREAINASIWAGGE